MQHTTIRGQLRRVLPLGFTTLSTPATLGVVGLFLLCAGTMVFSMGLGAVHLTVQQTVAILLAKVGVTLPVDYGASEAAVLLGMRLPRALQCVLVGAGLSLAGTAAQGTLRSPLADPGLAGASSAAAFGAAATLLLGHAHPETGSGMLLLTGAACAAAALALGLVYRFSHLRGMAVVSTMLLVGAAVNATVGGAIGVMSFVADDTPLRGIAFWTLGGLGYASWRSVAATAPWLGMACLAVPFLAPGLNALMLGETEAEHLGYDLRLLQVLSVGVMALGVGVSVAAAGILGFVGLVAPHITRLLLGGDHRTLFPGAAFLGGALLLLGDLLARTLAAPAEVPLGLLTAMVGAPFFLWLLFHERPRAGV